MTPKCKTIQVPFFIFPCRVGKLGNTLLQRFLKHSVTLIETGMPSFFPEAESRSEQISRLALVYRCNDSFGMIDDPSTLVPRSEVDLDSGEILWII